MRQQRNMRETVTGRGARKKRRDGNDGSRKEYKEGEQDQNGWWKTRIFRRTVTVCLCVTERERQRGVKLGLSGP